LPLRNGAGIKLTTARYYTPSGHSIQARGIEPDVRIRSPIAGDERKRESDLDRHLARETGDEQAAAAQREGMGADFSVNDLLGVLSDAGILSGTNPVTADRPMEEPL
jgi:carboxyl-terminal processing protease